MGSPVINCGWCRKPVPQPEDGNQKLYCNTTHKKRASEKRQGKPSFLEVVSAFDITCLGCGERRKTSASLRGRMAICPDCHWMSYAMCWRKERIQNWTKRKRKNPGFSYHCPICLEWHWTSKIGRDERAGKILEIQKRIGDYIRRMDFSAQELKDLPPQRWETRVVA